MVLFETRACLAGPEIRASYIRPHLFAFPFPFAFPLPVFPLVTFPASCPTSPETAPGPSSTTPCPITSPAPPGPSSTTSIPAVKNALTPSSAATNTHNKLAMTKWLIVYPISSHDPSSLTTQKK